MVKRLLAWLERYAHAVRARQIEAYLSRATDAADLESRIRQLERR
jgi:hypothetical protein